MPNGHYQQPGWSWPSPPPSSTYGNGLAAVVGELRERMATLEERSATVHSRLESGDRRMDGQDDRLNLLSGRLASIEGEHRQMIARLATIDGLEESSDRLSARLDVIDARRQMLRTIVTWIVALAAPLLALAGKLSWTDALGFVGRVSSGGG